MSTAGPAHRVQSAAVEYGYPQGHLGHLTADEEAAFENFKALCTEKGYYKPAEAGSGLATHDDATLLRFLRARRFVVPDAYAQFEDTENWRKANQLDELYETIDLEHYEETRRLYPQWTGRRDRRGIPVYVFEVRHLNSKTMAAYEKSAVKTHTKAQTDGKTSPKLLRLFALYENLIRFVMPLCTTLTDRDHPRTPITQSNNIVDISGVGLKQFWNLRGHMQDASTLATAHYPETLDRIFIIGAPAFFPTVWNWIKKWFDPITTSKIFILSSHDMKTTLEAFIDPANIPQRYGGQLEFEFGDMPVLDPALKDVVTWQGGNTNFPSGPLYWVEKGKDSKEVQLLGAGSTEDGSKLRREEICTVVKKLPETAEETGEKQNGHLTVPQTTTAVNSTGASASTETDVIPSPASDAKAEMESDPKKENIDKQAAAEKEEAAKTPAQPVPTTTVTTPADVPSVEALKLDEKAGILSNGTASIGEGKTEVVVAPEE